MVLLLLALTNCWLKANILKPVSFAKLQFKLIESEKFDRFDLSDQVLFVELFRAVCLLCLFYVFLFSLTSELIVIESSENGILALVIGILLDFLQNLETRKA